MDALLALRVCASALDSAPPGAYLPQRRRSGRVLHDRDVVEETLLPGTQARDHPTGELHLGQPVGVGLRTPLGRRPGGMGRLQREIDLVAAGIRIRGAVLPVELLDGLRHLCAAHAPARRLVRAARRVVCERGLRYDHGAYQADAAARRIDPLHSRARRPPREHGNSALSSQRGSGAPYRHSRRAAEFRSVYLALLLEHGAALQAVRFRAARVDRFRRTHYLRAARSDSIAASGMIAVAIILGSLNPCF